MMMVKIYGHLLVRVVILKLHVYTSMHSSLLCKIKIYEYNMGNVIQVEI